jgi:SAM-dependent methyltransferase
MDKTKRINRYQSAYTENYGFEAEMVRYRQDLVLQRLKARRPEIVVEIGCGTDLIYARFLQSARPIRQWLVVEPSPAFYRIARDSDLENIEALHGFFEDKLPEISEHLAATPDMIIMSSVLHEVPAPHGLLSAIRTVMGPESLLHVNVPNANSLHRQLAKSMGLIASTNQLSARNVQLLQHRVYDAVGLQAELETAGLSVVEGGGFFVKPFTHDQMQKILPHFGREILDGMNQLGRERPDMASEIFAEARRP